MSSSLGIYASQISGHLSTNNFSSIATQTVGSGGASSITFSSIPNTYTHLQLRISAKNANTGVGNDILLAQFNGDTTYTNYRTHWTIGNSGTISSETRQQAADPGALLGYAGTSATGTGLGACVADILDYTSTNKYKVTRGLSGNDNNDTTTGNAVFVSGLWINTAAVTSITIVTYNNLNSWASGSKFALYGVK